MNLNKTKKRGHRFSIGTCLLAGVCLLSMLCITPVMAQQETKTVTGTVTDKHGEPLAGVTIALQGTPVVTLTDGDGQYSIPVQNDNQQLRFSYIGYKPVTVGAAQSVVNVTLEEEALLIDEVVVTAMGIKKERKALGYAVQDIKSEELLKNKTANPLNSLAGKIAGVNVTQSSGAAGSGAQIILRGGTSLKRDNQPLFVVDGIIYDNSTSVVGNSGFDGLQGQATTASNRVMDINPEDIENMSILKGPAAAALYGSRAASGVIIITTKKGQEGTVEVNVSSKFTTAWANRVPAQQGLYKRGEYNNAGIFTDLTMLSWGDKFGAGETVYDNIGDFFQGGTTWDNSVSLSGGYKNGSFYLSASRFDQTGIIPNTGYDKTTFRFNGDQKYGKLTVGAGVAYSQANTEKTLTSAGLTNSGGTGAMTSVYRWARSDDMKKYLNDDGTKYRMFEGRQDLVNDVENPYWIINKNSLTDYTERVTGNLNLDFEITDWWNVSYRAGVDSYTTGNENFLYPGGAVAVKYQNGMISENDQRYNYLSSNLMTSFKKSVNDFDFGLLLGTAVESTARETNRRMGYDFTAPNFFSYNTISDPAKKTFAQSHSQKRMVSVYGELNAAYKNIAYLTVTGRNDWSSTLPVDSRSYFYPSVSGSIVFSELLPQNDVLSFGKIRASWAKVGKDADPYVTNTVLKPYFEYLGDLAGVINDSVLRGNPFLIPETTTSLELGLDVRFLDGRIGFDYTYYRNNSYNQLLDPRLSQAIGYIQYYMNVGDMNNAGMELSIVGQPVKTRHFTWESMLNISGNRGTVSGLLPGMEILYITEVQLDAAKAASFNDGNFMGMTGTKWSRTGDGKVIYEEVGGVLQPVSDGVNTYDVGNREPKFFGGFNNSFQYKGWNLSFLLDFSVGGDIYNGTEYLLIRNGMSKLTEDRESLTLTGVVQTGGTPENPVYEDRSVTYTANGTYGGKSGKAVIQDYWQNQYIKESANFITKTNWLRLRSVSLSYSIPKSALEKTRVIKGCVFTVTGNNLLLFTNYKGLDPEALAVGSGVIGSSSVGMESSGVPATAGMSFGVNLKF